MMGGKKCAGSMIAWVLVLIGALNWGLVGAFQFNLVELLLGGIPWLERLVYILVGLSALVALAGCRCKACKMNDAPTK